MLARHVLGYMPALVIPAIASFVAIFYYTRVLTPAEFGHYALALNAMAFFVAALFFWLQSALSRLIPQAVKENREEGLRNTAYAIFSGLSFLLLVIAAIYAVCFPDGDYRAIILFAVPLAIVRALLNIGQTFHRAHLRIRNYNIIECGQAVIGLLAGLAIVIFFSTGGMGAIAGMVIGMACMAAMDFRNMALMGFRRIDRQALKEILHFGVPMIATCTIATFLSVSDRFLVEHFCGAAELGIYAAGYTLMDRIIAMMYMAVATPSFPLTIRKMEHEGPEAAREQTYHNGVAALALALPACAGLILSSEHLAAILIGPEFRAGAVQVMPWIAVSAILGGMATHYFDHAFYLAKRPRLLPLTQGSAALLNLVLNLILIPRYGYMGAAYANVVAYALLLLLSVTVGRRVFTIKFPLRAALRIGLATAAMSAVLYSVPFPVSAGGLAAMVLLGGAVYGSAVWLLDVEGVRQRLRNMLIRAKVI